MAQWKRDRAADIASGRDERSIAECSPAEADILVKYDHTAVRIEGRRAVLISYHLSERDPAQPPRVQISYAHPDGHPEAPASVQALVERLAFRRWDGSV